MYHVIHNINQCVHVVFFQIVRLLSCPGRAGGKTKHIANVSYSIIRKIVLILDHLSVILDGDLAPGVSAISSPLSHHTGANV